MNPFDMISLRINTNWCWWLLNYPVSCSNQILKHELESHLIVYFCFEYCYNIYSLGLLEVRILKALECALETCGFANEWPLAKKSCLFLSLVPLLSHHYLPDQEIKSWHWTCILYMFWPNCIIAENCLLIYDLVSSLMINYSHHVTVVEVEKLNR